MRIYTFSTAAIVAVLVVAVSSNSTFEVLHSESGERIGKIVSADGTRQKLLYAVKEPLEFEAAWFYCRQAFGGILVAIANNEEDVFVKDFMGLNGFTMSWTSGIYEGGSWRWGEGPLIAYTNWDVGFPGSTSYAVYTYKSGIITYKWRTYPKTVKLNAICEST